MFVDGAYWIIEVIDNGVGVDEKKIAQIVAASETLYTNVLRGIDRLQLGGLGLLNSITRLRLLYNDQIYFSAKKMPQGTIIKFGGVMDAIL